MLNLIARLAAVAPLSVPPPPFDLESTLQPEAEVSTAPAAAAWKHSFALYFMAAGLDGESTVKGIDADVDVAFADIWDHLDAGAMLAYRAESERYAITVDTIYMGLAAEKDAGALTTKVEVDEFIFEVDGCLRVNPRFDVFAGARYWGLDTQIDITGAGPGVSAGGKEEWIDPLVGARYTWPFVSDWSLTVRGDIGGFGVGSEFSWQALARVNWQMSQATGLSLGYRVVDVDYQDGSGTDEFRYDVTTSGLLLGFVFSL